jgi:hypothetical protein
MRHWGAEVDRNRHFVFKDGARFKEDTKGNMILSNQSHLDHNLDHKRVGCSPVDFSGTASDVECYPQPAVGLFQLHQIRLDVEDAFKIGFFTYWQPSRRERSDYQR